MCSLHEISPAVKARSHPLQEQFNLCAVTETCHQAFTKIRQSLPYSASRTQRRGSLWDSPSTIVSHLLFESCIEYILCCLLMHMAYMNTCPVYLYKNPHNPYKISCITGQSSLCRQALDCDVPRVLNTSWGAAHSHTLELASQKTACHFKKYIF